MSKITTPIDKHIVELKDYITGRDSLKLKSVYLENAQVKVGDQATIDMNKVNMAQLTEKAEKMAIEMVVISVDGKKEDVVNKILDMNVKDYDYVINEINKITSGENFTKPE